MTSKLEKSLKEWVTLGFIDSQQASRIQEHESSKPAGHWIVYGLLVLGAVTIAIGVISLIAANWNKIPGTLRLAGNFLSLSALAFAAVRSWEKENHLHFEVLLLFFLLFCLASIGLIAQIFHTGGETYQALLFWSAITLTPMMAARRLLIPFLWTAVFLAGICLAALDSSAIRSIYRGYEQGLFLALPLLCGCLSVLSKWLAGEVSSTRAFRLWMLLAGLTALGVGEFGRFSHVKEWKGTMALLPGQILSGVVLLLILTNNEYRKLQKIVLLLILAFFVSLFHLPMVHVDEPLLYAVFTILILGFFSIFLASLNEMRLFQFVLFLLGARFLGLYFQALGGLAMTGIGLVSAGVLIISMVVLWNRHRKAIAARVEAWTR